MPASGAPPPCATAMYAVDLTSPARKSQLRVLAAFCDDADPGSADCSRFALCAKSGKDAYARDIVRERAGRWTF